MGFSKKLSDNEAELKQMLRTDENFDVVYREIEVGGRTGCLFFVDGFTKDEVLLKILQAWWMIKAEDMPQNAAGFSRKYLPYGEVGLIDKAEDRSEERL